jgi:hypothetical protein
MQSPQLWDIAKEPKVSQSTEMINALGDGNVNYPDLIQSSNIA